MSTVPANMKRHSRLSSSGRFVVGSRVLVVDGSASARALIMKAFNSKATNIECVACKSAKEALDKLEHEQFDLVTTSILLSDMDGLKLCKKIRSDEKTRLIPVIVISGSANDRLLMEGFSAGVTDYFDKSRGNQELVKFVSAFLERTHGTEHRILLVEDSVTVATAVRSMLNKQGMEVQHYSNAEDAFGLLMEIDRDMEPSIQFDLVLTDFHLKGEMTGGDLLHAIRTRLKKSLQELPVLVMTGNDSIKQQVEVFNAGANDYITKPAVEQVLVSRVRSLVMIRQQYIALERQKQQMEMLSLTDSLTGTYNRRYLMEYGEDISNNPDNLPLSAMIIDLDHFKFINDNYGHLKGDKVLVATGALLNDCTPDNAIVLRYGGEEFCVILPGTTLEEAHECAETLRTEIEAMRVDDIKVTISVGIAEMTTGNSEALENALKKADVALYSAKKGGRNRVELTSG